MNKMKFLKWFVFTGILPALATGQEIIKLDELAFGETRSVVFNVERAALEGEPHLAISVRLENENYRTGGSPGFMLHVNRVPMTAERFRNRAPIMRFGNNDVSLKPGNGHLFALYNEWENDRPHMGQLHEYVFDVSDVLVEGENRIRISNVFDGVPNTTLQIRDVAIVGAGDFEINPHYPPQDSVSFSQGLDRFRRLATGWHSGLEVELDIGEEVPTQLELIAPPEFDEIDYTAKLNDDGSLLLTTDGEQFYLRSLFAVNTSGLADPAVFVPDGEGRWVLDLGSVKIIRQIEQNSDSIRIVDQLRNLSDHDIPLVWLHQITQQDLAGLESFRLFGRLNDRFFANTEASRASAIYPVAYLGRSQAGLGIVVADDVLRNQASYLAYEKTLGIGTDQFYLQPDSSYTTELLLYPDPGRDYYSVINRLRRDWDLYQIIPGLFGFVYPNGIDSGLDSPEKIRDFLEATGITIPTVSQTMPTQWGNRTTYGNEPLEMIRETIEHNDQFLENYWDTGLDYPLGFYTDVHLVRTDGRHEILDELEDSLILDANGEKVQYRAGWLYNVLPTESTSAGKRFAENMSYYLEEVGFTAVYLDEWDHSRARYSFNHPDGYSAILNGDLEIIRKVGIVPLLTRNYQASLIKYVLEFTDVIFANQFDSTSLAQSLPIVHFAEPTQHDSYLLYAAQVSRAPLSLGVKRSSGLWLDVHAFLKKGVLTCYYARRLWGEEHLLKEIYPITVRSIEAGRVYGDDKIVSLVSGRHTLNNSRPLVARVFGGDSGRFQREIEGYQGADDIYYVDVSLDASNMEIALVTTVQEP